MVEEEGGSVASISNRGEKWRGSLLLRFSSSLLFCLFNGDRIMEGIEYSYFRFTSLYE